MRRIFLICLLGATSLGLLHAQDRPHFAGKWKLIGDPNGARALSSGLVSLCGFECEITETGSTLTIKRTPTSTVPMPEVLTFDWTQSRTFPGQGPLPGTAVIWTSEWKGATLVVTANQTTLQPVNQRRIEAQHSLSLAGAKLKIETSYANSRMGALAPVSEYHRVTTSGSSESR